MNIEYWSSLLFMKANLPVNELSICLNHSEQFGMENGVRVNRILSQVFT